MEALRNPPRLALRSVPLIVAGLVAGALVLAPAVGQAAAFLTKKKADRRYLNNNTVLTVPAIVSNGDGAVVTVTCPPGQQATGGGVDSPLFGDDAGSSILIQESKPVVTGTRTSGWNVEVLNNTMAPTSITAYAVCSP
jgi:hypothetical protein